MLNRVKADQLETWKSSHPGYLIIDVREEYEFEETNIGGKNIPLGEIINRQNEIDKTKAILFCCKSGKRSAAIAYTLHNKFGFNNIYSLDGGLENLLK